jgi:hypothetical protein
MQDKRPTEVVTRTENVIQQYYNRYIAGIDYATIGVTLLTFFTFVLQPLFIPSMSLATFLNLGFYGNVITRTALLVIIQKTYQRFARRNQLGSLDYKSIKDKLLASKNKVEDKNTAYDLEHFVAKKSLEERCYGLKDSYDIEINQPKTTYDRKKFLFDRKQQLLHLIASIQNDDLDTVLWQEFADELARFRYLDIDSAQLFVSGDTPKLPGNKYQVDVVEEERRNLMRSVITSLAITFLTAALIFNRNTDQPFVIDMLIMVTLLFVNVIVGTYRGLEIYLKIYAADTQKEILLSSFFGAINQKGKIEDMFEKAYQKQQAALPTTTTPKPEVRTVIQYVDSPWSFAQEQMEKAHEPLPGQERLKL